MNTEQVLFIQPTEEFGNGMMSLNSYLQKLSTIAIDMETATLFIVGLVNEIPRGALLLVSDIPMIPEGVKTEESDKEVTEKYC
ncbi:MAG: hypothetical protein MZV64_22590 [Ignavibacteriales bacterium]|nr:hypothetical protein [Ignavibacteriales bacterium]